MGGREAVADVQVLGCDLVRSRLSDVPLCPSRSVFFFFRQMWLGYVYLCTDVPGHILISPIASLRIFPHSRNRNREQRRGLVVG